MDLHLSIATAKGIRTNNRYENKCNKATLELMFCSLCANMVIGFKKKTTTF